MSEPTLERIKLAERRVCNVGSGVNPHMIAMEGQVLAKALRAAEAENRRLREHADEMVDVLEPFLGSDIEPEDKAVIWQTIAAYRGGGRE